MRLSRASSHQSKSSGSRNVSGRRGLRLAQPFSSTSRHGTIRGGGIRPMRTLAQSSSKQANVSSNYLSTKSGQVHPERSERSERSRRANGVSTNSAYRRRFDFARYASFAQRDKRARQTQSDKRASTSSE